MTNVLYQILAVILILAGLAVVPLPVPLGALMLALGLTILIGNSRAFTAFVRGRRRRHASLHRALQALERSTPRSIRTVLERSDPHTDDQHPQQQAD